MKKPNNFNKILLGIIENNQVSSGLRIRALNLFEFPPEETSWDLITKMIKEPEPIVAEGAFYISKKKIPEAKYIEWSKKIVSSVQSEKVKEMIKKHMQTIEENKSGRSKRKLPHVTYPHPKEWGFTAP